MGLLTWLRQIQQAVHKCADSIRRTQQQNGNQEMARIEIPQPLEVRAVVSYDQKTVSDAAFKDNRNHSTQASIRNATWAAFIAAAVYALVTMFMWCAMIKQNKIAGEALRQGTESFRIDERAWVEIQPIAASPSFRYELYPKNIGKTAATNITIHALRGTTLNSISMGDNAAQLSMLQDKMLLNGGLPDIPRVNPISKVLAPGTVAPVPFIMDGQAPQIFPKDEWVSYLIGRIDYVDAFNVPHWLKFCFFVVDAKGDLWNCKEGNDEDRNPELPPRKTELKGIASDSRSKDKGRL
jgi:hypothetical protein